MTHLQSARRHRRISRFVALLIGATLLAATAGIGDTQTNAEIERIREERRANDAAAAETAGEVNAADAELEEISAALIAINSAVNSQQGRVDNAQRQLADAEVTLANAAQAVVDGEALIAALERQLANSAISSFVNQNDTSTVLVESDDPNLGLRMQVLVDEVTQSGVDLVDGLRRAREDLEIERGIAERATADAEELNAELADELGILEQNQGVQADLASSGRGAAQFTPRGTSEPRGARRRARSRRAPSPIRLGRRACSSGRPTTIVGGKWRWRWRNTGRPGDQFQ